MFKVGDWIEVNQEEAVSHESPCTCCPAVVTEVTPSSFDMTQADGSWARSSPRYYQYYTTKPCDSFLELFL